MCIGMSWLLGSSKVGLDEGYIKLADILLNGSGLKFFCWRYHEKVFVAWPWRELKGSGMITRGGNQAGERFRIGNGKEQG